MENLKQLAKIRDQALKEFQQARVIIRRTLSQPLGKAGIFHLLSSVGVVLKPTLPLRVWRNERNKK